MPPLVRTVLVGGQVIMGHPDGECLGAFCCLHKPSDHHMRDWPQNWREDRRIMERLCPHEKDGEIVYRVGHPDPDDLLIQTGVDPGIHGCDGCCSPEARS